MKIGVLSDTHARRFEEIPETIVNGLAVVDLIVHAGDFIGKPVLEGLRGIAEVKAVHGNMDTGILKDSLPELLNFTAGGKKISVTHGWGAPHGLAERVKQKCGEADIIVFGHSHQSYNQYHGDTLLFNPGKAVNSYGILVIEQGVSARIIEL